jgi:hypothetical protein
MIEIDEALIESFITGFSNLIEMFTSCLPVVGGSLHVLRILPPLKLVAMI